MAPIGRPSRIPMSNPIAIGRPVPPPASFDDSELRRRLRALEGRRVPQFDPSALQQGIAGLQDQFANFKQFDPTNLQSQIGGLQDRLANFRQFDDSALRNRLQALEGREIPQFDPSNLQSQIGGLEDRLANIPQFDPSALQEQIGGLQQQLGNIPQFDDTTLKNRLQALESRKAFDPSVVQSRLDKLEGRKIPQFDPSQLEAGIQGLSKRISNLPQFDDTALRDRLQALEGREIPQFDDSALQDRLQALEGRKIPTFDPSQLQQGIAGLEDRLANIPQFDPSQLQQQIQANRDLLGNIPQFDDSALRDRLQALEGREMPQFDPSQLQAGIQGLSERISNLPQFDPSALQNRLSALENRQAPTFNPEDFREQFLNIAREGIDIPQPTQAFDPSGLQNRLQALENREMPQFDPSRLQERLSALENVQPVAPTPAFDPSSLQARLDALENREPVAAPPAFDPSGLMARLDDFESRLGALQQPFTPTDLEPQPPNEIPKPIPGGGMPIPSFDPAPPSVPIQGPPLRGSKIIPGGRPTPPMSIGGPRRGVPEPPGGFANVNPPQLYSNDLPGSELPPTPVTLPGGGRPTPPMSIGGPGGNDADRFRRPLPPLSRRGGGFEPEPVIPIDPITGLADLTAGEPMTEVTDTLARSIPRQIPFLRDDIMFPGGSPTFNERGETFVPPENLVSDGPPETVVAPQPAFEIPGTTTDPVEDPGSPNNMRLGNANFQLGPPQDLSTGPDNIGGGAPSLVDQQMQQGPIDPVLMNQQASEVLTDPLIRSLYFGTADQPGFFQQLQQAGANLIGSDVPLQQTAGLSPLELLARQQAVAGLGGFEPFLQQNRELINQAIEQSRRAEGLQDPYYPQAEEIFKDTMGAYDPSMTQQFFNPFEDAVVQQTIDDVLEAGEQQDIAARAQEIGSGAFGGSRARLGAMERREALGEGLAQALGNIRQRGFSEAQQTGLSEFARQQAAKRTGAQGLIGIGVGRGSAAQQLGQQLAGYGGQMGGLGATQEQLRAGQRGELAGFGGVGRGIAETGLARIFQQQLGQQQRPLGVLGQIASMLPGYQQSRTQIDSQYGMPTDPTAAGLGAAFSAYGALAPRQGSS